MKSFIKKLSAAILTLCMVIGVMPLSAGAAVEEVSSQASVQAVAETSGTFTAVALNVDGLPQSILGISINADGPGSEGTTAMSQKIATYGWDIIGVSENFNFNTELMSSLTNYSGGTHRGGVSGLSNDTDGLNLIWKNSLSVTGESWTAWETEYSSGIFGTGNGADSMIDKGYRFYQVTIAEGVVVDVYILHMDAASDAEDIAARESQLTQLVTAIKASNNGNPIIVMGDTNCRYTRENLQTIFIDGINADSRFTVQDTWIEKVHNNTYPVYGADAMVAVDKGGTYEYPQAEIVDKVFYINNTESDVTLTANSYTIALDFVDDAGTALADHWPVVVEFGYSVKGAEVCEHTYQVTTVEATCTEAGSKTYTCGVCGDKYSEEIAATGHTTVVDAGKDATCTETGLTEGSHCGVCQTVLVAQQTIAANGHKYEGETCTVCGEADPDYVPPTCEHSYEVTATVEATCTEAGSKTYTCSACGDTYAETITANGHKYEEGTCTVCGEADPNYVPVEPAVGPTLGAEVSEIVSGKKYTLTFSGTTGVFAMERDESNTIVANKFSASEGDSLSETQIWTISEKDEGYTISTEIDGKTYYLYRSKTYVGYGYRVKLQEEPYVWYMSVDSSKGSIRFYDKTSYGSKFYLRYYNARLGWIASTRAAGVHLHEVNE